MPLSKTVVMTGATGFIGSHLRSRLEKAGYTVYAVVRNARHVRTQRDLLCEGLEEGLLKVICEEIEPQFVISLAGRCGPGRNLEDFEVHYKDNILPAIRVAGSIPPSVTLALFFGSCEEYGNGPTPFIEEQAPVAFSPYGWAKISAHFAATLICRERKVPFTWVRPFLTFGPGQKTGALIPSVISACQKGSTVSLTPGEQTRDFLYVEDLSNMILRILENPEPAKNQVLNLASGTPRKIRDVAQTIQNIVGRGKIALGQIPYRSNEAMSFYASTKKYDSLYGRPPYTPFEEALIKTIGTTTVRNEALA